VIATQARAEAFRKNIKSLDGYDSQLIFLDAGETLARLMNGGQPDWRLFERVIESAINRFARQSEGTALRIYGEMVGLLWNAGKYAAAIRLEQFWNQLLSSYSFNLYCAYPIDVFGNEFQVAALDALLCAHTHVISAAKGDELAAAINRSMDDLLGRRAEGLRRLMFSSHWPSWARMPKGEADILWIRNNLPDEAESIVARARQYFQISNGRSELTPAGVSR